MSRWIEAAQGVPEEDSAAVTHVLEPSGPSRPQRGVELTRRGGELGRFEDTSTVQLWVLGTHSNAGEQTISDLLPASAPAAHQWPVRADYAEPARVLLVCRTSHKGLKSAQRAAVEFVSGTLPTVRVVGLVRVADAPGRLPKELRDLSKIVAGGFPEVWDVPWIEDYRLGVDHPALPREAATTMQTISDHLALNTHKKEEHS
ncbi:DUF6668 family protein [Plantibacter sp. RU18]|uniref:DUF6668 family protein n=1 Tax=Plantibacter sp. RU18 TaxID=3158143 RepID=UPI003D361FFF